MAAQTSASSSRASAKRAQRRAKRSESLSGSMRQFLTPEVWKQVKHAASQHGCRNGVRWTLQPLIMIAAIMTWCAGETDADRFVLSRSFYVQIHCPSDSDLARRLAAFARRCCVCPCPSGGHSAMPCGSRGPPPLGRPHDHGGLVPLGCDGSRMECPRRGVGTELGEVQQGQIGTDAVGDRLGQLDHWGLWSWRLGTSKTGERRYLIDLLETLPQAVLQSVLLVCDAGYVGYDLFGLLLKQQCSFLIRLSSQAQLYSLEMVKVEGFTEGEFWYWTDDAENQSKPALRASGDPSGGPGAQERRLVGHQRSGPQAVCRRNWRLDSTG